MTEITAPVPIADDGSAVIQREVAHSTSRVHSQSDACIVYEIPRTAQIVLQGGCQRVALQFPDELLADATLVADELQKRLAGSGCRVFILADTSYGSCCVDEVAAEHYEADIVVHYGRTCLSLTSRIPVFYVFGREPVDVDDCVLKTAGKLHGCDILLMCDVPYAYALESIAERMRADGGVFGSVVVSEISVSDRPYVPKLKQQQADIQPGRTWKLDEGKAIGDYTIVYIGGESLTLTNIMVTERGAAVYSYDPQTQELREESRVVNRHLNRRYYLVQRAKDADVVGILVGTLAAVRYLRVVEALKELLRRRSKKYYVFVVGKLNVAKLANFPEIEAFVLVACPENSLVDSRDFFQPIVTPYELLLALSRTREWTGDYVTDFHAFLEEVDSAQQNSDDNEEGEDDDDVPHFSLVTGALKQSRKYNNPRHTQRTGDASEEAALVGGINDMSLRNKNTAIAQYLGSAGAEYLLNRSFRGLGHDDNLDAGDADVEPMLAVDGLSGIARGYDHEKTG